MWYLIFLCCFCISFADSSLAPFITKCKPDDSKCLKESMLKTVPLFADGISELNVEKLDPMKIKKVDASNANLKLIVSDITLTGLKNCEAKKLSRDVPNSKLLVKILCTCNLEGKYDMNGQLFVLPIQGNGDVHATIRKILINVDVDLDEINKEEKKHWKVKSWKHSFDLKDKSDVKFENLFPDNELLRNTTNELIASNGNDVIQEIGAPVIKAVVAKVVKSIEHFFSVVPLEDLVLD